MASVPLFVALESRLRGTLDAEARAALVAFTARARAYWQNFEVAPEHWTRAIATTLADNDAAQWAGVMGAMDARGLWLACAVTADNSVACAAFDRMLVSIAGQVFQRAQVQSCRRDELTQQVRVGVLAPRPDSPAKLAQYRGQGSLAGWLRVIASRVVADDRRRAGKQAVDPLYDDDWVGALPIETVHHRRDQRSKFARLVREAFLALDHRQSNLMRLRHLRGLTVTTIGRAYQVDPSTISRWLSQARATLRANFEQSARKQCRHSVSVSAIVSAGLSDYEGDLLNLMVSAPALSNADADPISIFSAS